MLAKVLLPWLSGLKQYLRWGRIFCGYIRQWNGAWRWTWKGVVLVRAALMCGAGARKAVQTGPGDFYPAKDLQGHLRNLET